jgi:hypothetical protein
MISDSELARRLEALERRMNEDQPSRPGGPFRILRVTGGLPGPINWAYAGSHRWKREAEEELEAFCERAARAAKAEGETSLNVGGLPRGDELAEFKTFEEWWATIAPDYSDVPPEEPPGYSRTRGF